MRVTPRTKVILPVDFAGHPADLEPILQLAERHGLTVIEDACHALGAEYRGQRLGSMQHMTVFSFHPVKHITTGEGGMVTTGDARTAEMLRCFRNHGISSDARKRQSEGQWRYEMVLLGFNYRLTDIACALGCSNSRKLDSNLARRRQIASRYAGALAGIPGLIPPPVRSEVLPAWHLYPFRLDLSALSAGRGEIFRALRAENIGVNVHYIPVHFIPIIATVWIPRRRISSGGGGLRATHQPADVPWHGRRRCGRCDSCRGQGSGAFHEINDDEF